MTIGKPKPTKIPLIIMAKITPKMVAITLTIISLKELEISGLRTKKIVIVIQNAWNELVIRVAMKANPRARANLIP